MAKKKNLSISGRLEKASQPSTKLEIVNEWAKKNQDELFDIFRHLEDAIGRNDLPEQYIALDRLKNIGIKSFGALPNIAKKLAYPKNTVRVQFKMSDTSQKQIYNLLQEEENPEQLILELLEGNYGVDNE